MPKLKRRLTSIQKIDEEDLISKETCTSNKEDESGDGNTPKQSSKRKKNGVDDSTLHKATKHLKMDDTQLSGSNKRSRPDKADMIVSSSDGTQGHLPFPTVVKDDQPFSPRRSGRGFKPNRKFKDMELEYNPLKQKVKDKEKQMQNSDMKKPVKLTQNQRKDQMTATVKGLNQGGKGNRSVGKLAKKLQATAVSCISDDDKQCSEETDQGKTRSTKTGQIIRENLSSKSSLPSEDIHVSGIDEETVDISKIDAREAIEDMGDRDLNEVSVILNPETGLFVMSSSGEKVEPSVADSTIVKTEKEVDTEQNVETPKTIHPTNLIELVESSRTRRTDSKEATVKYREMDKTSKKDGMITKEETVVKRKSLESQSSVNNTYMEISSAENSQLTEVNKDSENDLNGDTTLKEKVDTKCLEDEEALDKGDCSLTKVDAEALEKAVESIAVKTENEIRSDTSIGSVAQGEECGSIQGECDDVSQSEEEVKVAMQSLIENVDDGSVIELVEIPDNESSTVEANLPKLTTPRGTKYVVRGESQDSVLVINTGSNVMMGRNASKRSEDSKGQDTGKQGRVLPAGSFKTQEMQTQTPYNMPISQRIKIIRGEGHSITVTSSSSSDGAPVSETSSGDLAVLNETSAVSGDVASKSSGKELNEQFIIVELPEGQSVKRKIIKEPEQELDNNVPFTIDEDGDHVCGLCSYKTSKKANWYKHKKRHSGQRIHKCPYCEYYASTSSNLKRHVNIHKDVREHKCPFCSLSFRQKIHLERHIKYKHEEKKVQCPLCDYMCANENPDLKIHIRRRHLPQDAAEGTIHAFKCEFCDLVTVNKKDLRQHMKFHKHGPELKLFCEFCSFVTDCESRLRRHMLTHTRERPFQCGLCEYRASQKEHVLRHMKSQHNIDVERRGKRVSDDLSESESRDSNSKQDRQDFSSQEKIFACNHCSMKFSKLLNLYKHLHTQHKNILPSDNEEYLCVVCDFRTTSKKNLLVHMRKHNMQDQLPPSHVFSCVLCRYINPKRRNLFQHMKKKHGIEIILKDDGSTSCYITENPGSTSSETTHGELSIGDSVSSNSEDSQLQVLTNEGADNSQLQVLTNEGAGTENIISLEDLAYAMSHPKPFSGNFVIDEGKDSIKKESKSASPEHGTDAAEAIEGLQALAEQPGIVPGKPSRLPNTASKTEVSLCQTEVITMDTIDASVEPAIVTGEEEGVQLSQEQIMHLSSGDFVEINGEMYKVEISHDDRQDQQVIESSIQEATAIDNVIPCSPVINDMMQSVLHPDGMI